MPDNAVPRRRWLRLTSLGFALVVLALITVALVLFDKPHFGWMVGSLFLEFMTAGVVVGSVLMLIGAWNLAERKTWRGIALIAWALIAITSPAFGLLFLVPWGLLAISSLMIGWILATLFRPAVA
ncbi:MAG TPA: hypothetical protein VJZ00_09855 [Thermoanaerobaculia bacterium]|nr:hypothetical protein [Thermoanaerobaculia bacterium]